VVSLKKKQKTLVVSRARKKKKKNVAEKKGSEVPRAPFPSGSRGKSPDKDKFVNVEKKRKGEKEKGKLIGGKKGRLD